MHPDLERHSHVTRDIKPPAQCPACDNGLPDITPDERLLMLYDVNHNLRHANERLKQAYEAEKHRNDEENVERDIQVMDAISLAQNLTTKWRLANDSEVRLRTELERLVAELHDNPIAERITRVLDGYKETPHDEPDAL